MWDAQALLLAVVPNCLDRLGELVLPLGEERADQPVLLAIRLKRAVHGDPSCAGPIEGREKDHPQGCGVTIRIKPYEARLKDSARDKAQARPEEKREAEDLSQEADRAAFNGVLDKLPGMRLRSA